MRHGPSNLVAACNEIRTEQGEAPVSAEALKSDDDEDDDGDGASSGEAAARAQPAPISDELLAELRRRLCAKLGRNEGQLPGEKWLRAAADLVRGDVRGLRFDDPKLAVADVCLWYGCPRYGGSKGGKKFAYLQEMRDWLKSFGPLESLLDQQGLEAASAEDRILFDNLRMLLHSRTPLDLSTIAVAVYLSRDESLDVVAALVAHGVPATAVSKNRVEGVASTRDRIVELGLCALDHSARIEPSRVDRVREAVTCSIADAAQAVLAHSSDVDAAVEALCTQLGRKRNCVIDGYSAYGKVLEAHNAEQQRLNTLLMTNARLPACRRLLPGFHAIELELTEWLHQRFGTVVELYFAHGLRQSPETLRSTGFAVHQDTEEFDFIDYTVVVKLTPDEPDEPPSAMRVVGASQHFRYAASAGAGGCFRSRLHHASVEPQSDREHLKIAYFFRVSTKGERRAKRALGSGTAGAGAGGERDAVKVEEELAHRRKMVATDLGSYILGAAPELAR